MSCGVCQLIIDMGCKIFRRKIAANLSSLLALESWCDWQVCHKRPNQPFAKKRLSRFVASTNRDRCQAVTSAEWTLSLRGFGIAMALAGKPMLHAKLRQTHLSRSYFGRGSISVSRSIRNDLLAGVRHVPTLAKKPNASDGAALASRSKSSDSSSARSSNSGSAEK
jgi:hypothetical protein